MKFRAVGEIVLGKIQIGNIDDLFLNHEVDRRVVHQGAVLDRIRAGKNRAADGLRCMRVNRHRFSGFVCFVHCGFHLLERICRTAAGTAAQGAENLDDIDIGGDLFPHVFAHRGLAGSHLDGGLIERFAGNE